MNNEKSKGCSGYSDIVYFPQRTGVDVNQDTFSKALENGTATCKRVRLMVVGPAGVGKTSLIKRLMSEP